MSQETTVAQALIPAVREMAAQDPRCPYNAEACRTLPMDEDYAIRSEFGRGARAVIAAFLKAAHAIPGDTREWTLREWARALEAMDND